MWSFVSHHETSLFYLVLMTLSFLFPNNRPSVVPSDFVAVAVSVFVNGTVELATQEYKFYNCAATVKKSENTP